MLIDSVEFEHLPGGELPVLQLLLGFVIYVVAAIAGLLLFAPVLVARGVSSGLLDRLNSDATAATLFYGGFAVVSILGFAGVLHVYAAHDYALTFRRQGIARELAEGSLVGTALMCGGVFILWALGVYAGERFAWNQGFVVGVMMGIGAACSEEVLFRGLFLRILNGRFGSTIAVGATSLLFGAGHVPNDGVTVLGGLSLVLSAGLLLNGAYLLTNRLWAPIGIHFAWNAVQAGVFGIDVSGDDTSRGLFVGVFDGSSLLTGGSMGAEGSVVLVGLGLAAGVAVTFLALRRGVWRSYRSARAEVDIATSS